MPVSANCGVFISAWEGIKDGDPSTMNYDPYMDLVGIWTIGYGHALTDPATGAHLSGANNRAKAFAQYPGGITKASAVALLTADMARFEPAVNAVISPGAPQNQYDALVSFDFNTGHLAGSTLATLHRQGLAAGPLPADADIQALAGQVRAKAIKTPATICDAFAVWSFAKSAFVGGLFCRRLAEFAFYSGLAPADANAFGTRVRGLIAQ